MESMEKDGAVLCGWGFVNLSDTKYVCVCVCSFICVCVCVCVFALALALACHTFVYSLKETNCDQGYTFIHQHEHIMEYIFISSAPPCNVSYPRRASNRRQTHKACPTAVIIAAVHPRVIHCFYGRPTAEERVFIWESDRLASDWADNLG